MIHHDMADHEAINAAISGWTQRGSDADARWLMAEFYPRVAAIARNHLPRGASIEDLAQETFVKIFQHLHRYDGRAPFEHWISRIALNTCLDHLRAQRRRPELRWSDLSENEAAFLDATLAAPDTPPLAESTEARALFSRLLDALAPEDRLVITLLHLEQLSVAEISARTGWSRPVVKIRAFRARHKLRRQLASIERHAHEKLR